MKIPPLFIGRFQPFHLGHLDAVQQILAREDFFYIGIGSAENARETENPYTCGERYEMICAALNAAGIDPKHYAILMARDVNDNNAWVAHLERVFPQFGDVYIMDSPLAKKLFRAHGAHTVFNLEKRINVSATEVRRRMKLGENWQELVPAAVAEAIEKIGYPVTISTN
ncbi:nicotinamide-nucleotide adenylyltransferase [Candidatus Peregrinibacteria bacterium CG11_big_fil_rev_8_21_14_0_20_46_8]|nr:MAG: nicotinamide-nucleotide adenylyltransferase [Candidatus Peregrinibacteria bacterium CG11_big_fil_rev_8_21_14_0_20_46_8]